VGRVQHLERDVHLNLDGCEYKDWIGPRRGARIEKLILLSKSLIVTQQVKTKKNGHF